MDRASFGYNTADDSSQRVHLLPVDYSLLQEGDEVYFINKGKVKVSKIYEYPNKDDKVCEVMNSKNEMFCISFKDQKLFYLPYNQPKTLLDEINDSKNTLLLMPYVDKSEAIYNIYWKPIKDAARYIVSLYKQLKIGNFYITYHLADYDIDRNTHYLALENLIGENYIFKVTAEGRDGGVIAKSRAMELEHQNHSRLIY